MATVADVVEEMEQIDGTPRGNQEVIASSDPYFRDEDPESAEAENWTDQAQAFGADSLELIVGEMVERRLAVEREAIEGRAVARAMEVLAKTQASAADKPSLAMIAKVHDRFITESNAPKGSAQAWIKHFRCESAVSTKLMEIDLDLYDKYMDGEIERPKDPQTGRPYSDGRILNMCSIPGQYITWVDGHCYCFTDNQVRNVLRTQELDRLGLQGGMAGIYEDHGGPSWSCQVCPTRPSFADERTWRGHMVAVHAVAPATLG